MSYEKKFPDWKDQIIEASEKHSTAKAAAISLGIKYDTYKRYAEKYGVFNTNPGTSGMKFGPAYNKLDLWDILEGKHPTYPTSKLRLRLLKEEVFYYECAICGISEWQGKPAPLELDHIDGISHNHNIANLRLLCCNCHAQTPTYKARNIKKGR